MAPGRTATHLGGWVRATRALAARTAVSPAARATRERRLSSLEPRSAGRGIEILRSDLRLRAFASVVHVTSPQTPPQSSRLSLKMLARCRTKRLCSSRHRVRAGAQPFRLRVGLAPFRTGAATIGAVPLRVTVTDLHHRCEYPC